ncbi:hypothetical protein [Umboniibacter marinipuniceus]|uniref:Uncharacterized protein n=1 Tax=Umboniibacter marinipuniceus TaxID=569599 RepID=A0A3M0AG82_9GAMM|nr:hypothetical protein [Umboniibacter marinipuniceus]RMA82629.1 hypothetical protein DFR27_0580 [Umboniibacter marinipuniceus]
MENVSNNQMIIVVGVVAIWLLSLFFEQSRYFHRKLFRKVLYENTVVRTIRNRFLQVFLPGFTGAYFITLDVWGEQWDIIKNHTDKHEVAFSILIVVSLLALLIRGIADWYEEQSGDAYKKFLEGFTLLTTRVVQKKLDRFKDESGKLKPNGNTFKQITQPKEQINLILGEIESLLLNNFSLKRNQICITIMHNDPQSDTWYYEYETNRSWKHTKAIKLIEGKSAAAECLSIGEPVFHACKRQAHKKGKYYLSERDGRTGDGSVFCYPAFTVNSDYRDNYIISIVTYGRRLCDPLDEQQSEAISEIFSDICRRIDLELTLNSIKKWQYEFHTNKSRSVA